MKNLILLLLLAVAVAVLAALTCAVRPPPIPIEPNDTHMCAAACTNLQRLGCPEGAPIDEKTTCTQFCVKTQQEGHAFNPTCLAGIADCIQIKSCLVNRRGGR